MNQWDYKIATINTQHQPDVLEWFYGPQSGNASVQKALNSMGSNGWELVAFFPQDPLTRHSSILLATATL